MQGKQSASFAAHFEALAAQHEKQVYRTCYHMLGNREDALDCAQEAMLRAFRAFSGFRGEAAFGTWITRIAMNTCLDHIRKKKNVVSLDAMREDGADVSDKAIGTYAALEGRERMEKLREGLQALPDEMRAIVVMRDVRGMRYDKIGEALRLPEGTVKSRISRARDKLVKFLRSDLELFEAYAVKDNEGRRKT